MSTFDTMINDTFSELMTYVRGQESLTVLSQPCTANDLILSVDDPQALSRGTIEMADELIYIKNVSATAGTVQVIPGGRGWRGSTAQAHPAATILRNNPIFPRYQIRRAINDTIKAVDLRSISSHEFTFDGTTFAYVLPADANDVLGVTWDAPDSTGVWPILNRYRLDRNYTVNGEPRLALILLEAPMPGRTVRVQYGRRAAPLVELSDEFSDVTGLPASSEDCIRYGAMYRLVSTIDPGKVVSKAPSAEAIDQNVNPGEATTTARYLYSLFLVRLAEEKRKQQELYMSVINYTR
jgi:hypothetical protein